MISTIGVMLYIVTLIFAWCIGYGIGHTQRSLPRREPLREVEARSRFDVEHLDAWFRRLPGSIVIGGGECAEIDFPVDCLLFVPVAIAVEVSDAQDPWTTRHAWLLRLDVGGVGQFAFDEKRGVRDATMFIDSDQLNPYNRCGQAFGLNCAACDAKHPLTMKFANPHPPGVYVRVSVIVWGVDMETTGACPETSIPSGGRSPSSAPRRGVFS